MTVPEQYFEADRTNDVVTQYTDDYDFIFIFFLVCHFFPPFALFDMFCLAVLSEKEVHVKAAIKYVPVHHSDGFMEESKRDSASLYCCFITPCSSLKIQLWS